MTGCGSCFRCKRNGEELVISLQQGLFLWSWHANEFLTEALLLCLCFPLAFPHKSMYYRTGFRDLLHITAEEFDSFPLIGCFSVLFFLLVVEVLRLWVLRKSSMRENPGASVAACRLRKSCSHYTSSHHGNMQLVVTKLRAPTSVHDWEIAAEIRFKNTYTFTGELLHRPVRFTDALK